MSNNSKNKLVPRLRFPEFKNEEGWEKKKLEEVLNESKIPSIINNPQKRITVRLNLKGIEKREFRGTEAENATYFFIRSAGQFIYGKQNIHKGAFGIIPDELDGFESSQDIPSFNFSKGFHSFFFYYLFSRESFYNALEHLMTGTGSKRLHPEKFLNLTLPFPYLPEQQRIAACLSSLDEVIAGEGQKLELLKQHKKGLLQNLFPHPSTSSGGSTVAEPVEANVPRLRFKEFENSGEWVVKKLGEIGEFTGGGTPSKANDSYWQGIIPWISSSDILDGSIHQINISRYISEEALKESATKLVPANSILIVSRVGVGKIAITKETICTSQDFTNFTPKKDDLTFLAYYLQTQANTLLGFSQGMAIKGFTKDDISKLNLSIPSLAEQQRIAACLSSLDDLINAQSQKIETLKEHKKGLLQGLFPQMSEP